MTAVLQVAGISDRDDCAEFARRRSPDLAACSDRRSPEHAIALPNLETFGQHSVRGRETLAQPTTH